MKEVPVHTTKMGNPIPKPPAGDSSKAPAEPVAKSWVITQATASVLDEQGEKRSDTVPMYPTEKPASTADPREAAFLKELKEKFGSEEEARRAFALFSALHQEKSTGAATAAPPPPIVPEETTAQPSIAHTEEPQVSIGALAHDQSHAEGGGDLLERMVVEEQRDEEATEEGTPVSGKNSEGKTLAVKNMEGECPVVESTVGETPFVYVEGGTPFTSVVGETPGLVIEGEMLKNYEGKTTKYYEGETPEDSVGIAPVVFAEGETPGKSLGEEIPVNVDVQKPEEEGLKEIVDLEDIPEKEEDAPVDLRESRRLARRSLLDEIDD